MREEVYRDLQGQGVIQILVKEHTALGVMEVLFDSSKALPPYL
jgi:hypothetical protein